MQGWIIQTQTREKELMGGTGTETIGEGSDVMTVQTFSCTKVEGMQYFGWLLEDTEGGVTLPLTKDNMKKHEIRSPTNVPIPEPRPTWPLYLWPVTLTALNKTIYQLMCCVFTKGSRKNDPLLLIRCTRTQSWQLSQLKRMMTEAEEEQSLPQSLFGCDNNEHVNMTQQDLSDQGEG